jgi:ribosomal protein S18 acetylase RimI-like enzyme
VELRRLLKAAHRALTTKPHVPMTPEQLGALVLRDAGPADLDRLAQLHVDTFNETHAGPLGSGPTFALRRSQWKEKLGELHATNFVIVLETPEKELVGFCWAHPTNDNPRWAARLNKIYLLRPYQRQGLGTRMMRAAVDRLVANGLLSMALFTEVDNVPACSFYEKLGAEHQLGDDGKFGGMYGWSDLRVLQQRLNS